MQYCLNCFCPYAPERPAPRGSCQCEYPLIARIVLTVSSHSAPLFVLQQQRQPVPQAFYDAFTDQELAL